MNTPTVQDLTLVIDIGKSNAKLLLVDDAGVVVERHARANACVIAPLGYPALDVHGLQTWMQAMLRASPNAKRCARVIISTHGAALVALSDEGLAWEPLDYEFDGLADNPTLEDAFHSASDAFAETLSPDLPAGLNAARQLFWMQNTHADAWRRTRCLVPYPQYWAWRLSGEVASEVSSLGCHTHLWNPLRADFSALASINGWASLFAPLHSAWEVLGAVGERSTEWGLPADCVVHVGVHDSNACLARYLNLKAGNGRPLTVVSSGTWTVLMAPGAPSHTLVATQDMLGNVDVTGRVTPTARFMGGREFDALLDGAPPQAASIESLQRILATQTFAMPAFSHHGGPFADRQGYLLRQGEVLEGAPSRHLDESTRATLAAIYCAQITTWLIRKLWTGTDPTGDIVIVEGPLSHNAMYLQVLQALNPGTTCLASQDDMEGTARGAWLLTHWNTQKPTTHLVEMKINHSLYINHYQMAWIEKLAR